MHYKLNSLNEMPQRIFPGDSVSYKNKSLTIPEGTVACDFEARKCADEVRRYFEIVDEPVVRERKKLKLWGRK